MNTVKPQQFSIYNVPARVLMEGILSAPRTNPKALPVLEQELMRRLNLADEITLGQYLTIANEIGLNLSPTPPTTPPTAENDGFTPLSNEEGTDSLSGGGESEQEKAYKWMQRNFVNTMFFCLGFGAVAGVTCAYIVFHYWTLVECVK